MSNDLGIGLGPENMPFGLELMLQYKVVLDDSVVHNDEVAGTVAVWMGILLVGPPVSRPACMTDPGRSRQWGRFQVFTRLRSLPSARLRPSS